MINIRSRLFETNSSAVRAIIIDTKEEIGKLPESLKIEHGDFGWKTQRLRSPEEKASYLWETILSLGDDGKKKDYLERFEKFLRDGEISPVFDATNEFECGYVDPAYSDLADWIFEDPFGDRLKYYLFGKNSYVSCGNDNSDTSYDRVESDYDAAVAAGVKAIWNR